MTIAQNPDEALATLAEHADRLAAATNFDDVVDTVLKEVKRALGAKHLSLWFLDADGALIRAGSSRSAETLPDAVVRKAMRAKQGIIFTKEKLFGCRRLFAVPLVAATRPLGLMIVGDAKQQEYTPAWQAFVVALVRQSTLALSNATHMEQMLETNAALERQTRKLQQLYQVLERFARDHDEEAVLRRIPKLACSALESNYALIQMIEGDHLRYLDSATRRPYDKHFLDLVKEPYSMPIKTLPLTPEALKSGQPMIIEDVPNEGRIDNEFARTNVQNYAVVPITLGRSPIAVLYIAHHVGGPTFTPGDLELINVFSKICSFVLANVHNETHERRGFDVSKIRARTAAEFVKAVVKEVPSVVNAGNAAIALPNKSGILKPAAFTSRRYDAKNYKEWLARIPFNQSKFELEEFPGSSEGVPALIHGSMAVPIRADSQILGMLQVFERQTGTFSSEDLSTLHAVASRIGYVLANLEMVDELREERQQFASIVRGSADGIISLNAQHKVEFVNPAVEELTGYPEAELKGKIAADMLEARDESGQPISLLANLGDGSGSPQVSNLTIRTKGGTRRWVGVTSAPEIKDTGGSHKILVMRDITKQYELQKRQSEFVSIASHELRTPLTALIGYLSLLQKGAASPEQTGHFTERAYAAATRLSNLVEDLLNVARIEDGRIVLELQPVNPAEVIQDVIAGAISGAEKKGINLVFQNRLDTADLINVDTGKLTQIFSNLVDNAIKYTPEKGSVIVSARSAARYLTLSVRDSGIGIHPSNVHRIFDKFYREYSELSVEAGGTGLGLFITKELVELQGGTLTVKSKHNEGTTAIVRFPRYVTGKSTVAASEAT